MPSMRTLRALRGLVTLPLLSASGCISPLDTLESEVDLDRSLQSTWSFSGAVETAPNFDAPAAADAAAPGEAVPIIDEHSSLEQCFVFAARRSAELESAFLSWRAALDEVPQVTALPDPRLSYGYFINEVETRVGPQRHRIMASQMVPWFGKLELQGSAAGQAAEAEFRRLQATLLGLFERVGEAYCELYYLRSAIDTTRESVRLLEQLEQLALARFRVGQTTYADVLRIQVELGTVQDRRQELEDRRRPLAARLNAELGRPADARAPWPETLPDPAPGLDDRRLAAVLRQRNPELAALDHELERERIRAELAHKSAYPDLTFSVDYIVTDDAIDPSIPESGDDAVIAGVSVNVPLWRDKYEAAVTQSLKRRLAIAARRTDTERRLLAALEQAMHEYRDGHRKLGLYRDSLVPKARESLESLTRAYETANVSFLDLIDAERALLELELSERRARTDVNVALARIQRLVGGDLDQARGDQATENRP